MAAVAFCLLVTRPAEAGGMKGAGGVIITVLATPPAVFMIYDGVKVAQNEAMGLGGAVLQTGLFGTVGAFLIEPASRPNQGWILSLLHIVSLELATYGAENVALKDANFRLLYGESWLWAIDSTLAIEAFGSMTRLRSLRHRSARKMMWLSALPVISAGLRLGFSESARGSVGPYVYGGVGTALFAFGLTSLLLPEPSLYELRQPGALQLVPQLQPDRYGVAVAGRW